MICLKRTSRDDTEFKGLITLLNAELKIIDGDEHAFYQRFSTSESLDHALVVCVNGDPLACGALRKRNHETMEIKRMFTAQEARGQGLAGIVLNGLENWAKELGYLNCVLETGNRQQAAVALYAKNGYHKIPNYSPYKGVDNSICFGKEL